MKNRRFFLIKIVGMAFVATNTNACKSSTSNNASNVQSSGENSSSLSQLDLQEVATKEATCPFMGPAVAQGNLKVHGSKINPLASVEDVKKLGNSGGGDLGNVLAVFAEGNHTLMLGASGQLDTPTPLGIFSLIFPGSQGSHPGNSEILKPAGRGSPREGRTDLSKFQDFVSAANGSTHLKRSQIASRIAQNVYNDPNALVFGASAGVALAKDVVDLATATSQVIIKRILGGKEPQDYRQLMQALTEVAGKNNLIGSSGEFGLLAAFLANSPNTRMINGEPAYAIADLHAMFIEKKLPDGWETWPKYSGDWVKSTLALASGATKSYVNLRRNTR
ncbi:MAG: hypothetical protein WCI18_16750 [Pseudomonadota bacterium]